jgi:AGCS family alanine or glycine:cation symporter
MAILVALVIIGGLKRISDVTTYLVPFMAVFYVIGGSLVILFHLDLVPNAIYNAVYYAFNDPMAMPGAIAGWSIKMALTKGVARGVFSNEAGLGSAPMVHATAITDHPAKQGCYGLFEVFMDTIVICSITCIAILTTGTLVDYPDLTGAQLTLTAFSSVLGQPGVMILSLGLAMFAFSTILGWYWYGETGATYIFGLKVTPVYKVLWIVVVVIGAWGGGGKFLANIWNLSDTMNGLMAAPNLVALLWLSNEMRKIVKDFDQKRAQGKIKAESEK